MKEIFGSELLFLGIGVGCVYSGAVFPMFLLVFGFSFPKVSRENSLLVRFVFLINFWERTFVLGNRIATVSFFPFSKGEMLSVFSFGVFCVRFGVFCRFFAIPPFLGSLFEKIFGSELLFWGSVWVFRVLVLFCLCFCFFFVAFSLPKLS